MGLPCLTNSDKLDISCSSLCSPAKETPEILLVTFGIFRAIKRGPELRPKHFYFWPFLKKWPQIAVYLAITHKP